MNSFAKLVVAALTLTSVCAWAASGSSLEDRIKPVGESCMAGDSCAATLQVAAAGEPRSGMDVYDSKCATCHATGAAGAPKLGDIAAWASRMPKGMAVLHQNAIKGVNGMPAMGLCFDCSEDEIMAAVDYIVEKSK